MNTAMDWLSRTIAIVAVMVAPGMLGNYLDRRLGTQFLSVVGFLFGMALATTLLIVIAQKLTPPAGGQPIPFDDDADDDWPDDKEQDD